MQYTPHPRNLFGHVKWTAVHRHAIDCFGMESPIVSLLDLPMRIVRRSRDNLYIVACGGEEGCHLTRVLTNAGKFGSVVYAVNKYSHINITAGKNRIAIWVSQ